MTEIGRTVADWARRQHDLGDAMRRAGNAFASAQERGRLRRWHLAQPPPRAAPTPPHPGGGDTTKEGRRFDD